MFDFYAAARHTSPVPSKRHRSEPSGKNARSEYATFENALKKVLSVPRSEMRATLDAEKKRHRASSRASSGKR